VILQRHLLPALRAVRVRAIHLGHIKTLLAEKRATGYGKNMLA
jgi:hypothetical protein